MKGKRMCPNEGCEHYGKPTRLMGGCGCGTGLVPFGLPEPTNEQLESLCFVLGVPVWPGWFDRNPVMRQGALNLHRLVQRGAMGDPEANAALRRFQAMFSEVHSA